MTGYSQFNAALYFTTRCIANYASIDKLEQSFQFFEKHLKCSKVYLESHRDDMDVPREKLEEMKQFFQARGIAVSGAITTTWMKTIKNKPFINETGVYGSGGTVFGSQPEPIETGYKRTCTMLCYTNEEELNRLADIVQFSASLFDEVIIDDFFFTNCTCLSCIKAKGDRSWADFRLQLMTNVSENVVMRSAKSVNPKVNMIIKFPDWYESYQETGYNPETQSRIFDEVYTGTETRDSNHSAQSLPRYGSYSLMRLLEDLKPGHNAGGWIDALGSTPHISYFLEQAYLTLFAKGRELTLFCYSWLIDTVQIPALGHELERLDKVLGELGNPVGLSAYEPFHGRGEDHVYDHLGMVGIALEPSHQFPNKSGLVLVTANCAQDPAIIEKLKAHLLSGSDICMTSGFLRDMQGRGIEEITSARSSHRKAISNQFVVEVSGTSGQFWSGGEVLLPVIEYMSNAGDCLVALKRENNWVPVLLRNRYGPGTVYILTVPDDYVDLYSYPKEVLTTIRQYLMSDCKLYLECGGKISIFLYDNDTFIVSSFLDRPENIKVHVQGNGRKLVDVRTGNETAALYERENESVFEIEVQPLLYRVLRSV
jgi:hypothetical protein